MLIESREITDQLDLFMCIQCGKCTAGCPIATKTNFNLRMLIYNMLVEDKLELQDTAELWDCTTCYTCSNRCPKDVHPADVVMALRAMLVEKGNIPRTIGTALTSIFRNNNPFELPHEDRWQWADGLDLVDASQQPVEVLLYAGCLASYDHRAQKIARSIVSILTAAQVRVGLPGIDEICCGSEVRRVGERGLFEMIVEQGTELLASDQASVMITISPHCFDVFTHRYPAIDFPVQHYTQYLHRLITEGRLTFQKEINRKVTYHDPCYLGKQNKVFHEPRAVLQSLPGIELVEMDRSFETSLCCEGGGGKFWCEGTNPDVRLGYERIREALDTGAQIVATACPFCLTMLEDAVIVLGVGDQIQVRDIAELAAEAL